MPRTPYHWGLLAAVSIPANSLLCTSRWTTSSTNPCSISISDGEISASSMAKALPTGLHAKSCTSSSLWILAMVSALDSREGMAAPTLHAKIAHIVMVYNECATRLTLIDYRAHFAIYKRLPVEPKFHFYQTAHVSTTIVHVMRCLLKVGLKEI